MTVLEPPVSKVQSHVHSLKSFLYIDKAFADLAGVPGDLEALGRRIRA
jgi:hypothetical protein